MTEEHKEAYKHEETHKQEHKEEVRIGLPKIGKDRKSLENISFYIIVISAAMVSIGIGIGSFIPGTIFIGSLGAFFVMIGIVIYIISQFLEGKNG